MSYPQDRASLTPVHLDWGGLRDAYRRVRSTTADLVAPLTPEDTQVQSMPDASPTKWHLAHTTWFFETFVLVPSAPGYHRFHDRFAYLFNSYYEAAGPRHDRKARGLVTRPGLDEIFAYRAHVDTAMMALLERGGAHADEMARLIELGLHHEQQHQELILMDIKHAFAANPIEPYYAPPIADNGASPRKQGRAVEWVSFAGGLKQIGHAGSAFAFDNEGPRHKVWLEPFQLADRLVTCGEYLAFMADGAYQRADLWLSEGWATVQASQWRAPLYWREETSGWTTFTLCGRRSVDPEEPVVHVSFYEADAFARWANARLPTEAEWETAAEALAVSSSGLRLHPRPASNEAGLRQMTGEVWAWTASAYLAYPGFAAASGAVGEYNGKFMSNQMVLRGSACVTPEGHARATYRNFFPPASRWAFSGLRLAR